MLKGSRPDLRDLPERSHLGLPIIFDRVFLARSDERESVIAPIEPFTLDERLTIQQGFFFVRRPCSGPSK